MIEIKKNVPKPEGVKSSGPGQKYPLSDMQLGDSFFVPYGEMQSGDTPQKFRNRIHQSVKNFALRTKTEEGRQKHSVALMTKDDESVDKMYFAGDVGVWRDE